jgi:hypothetical protein
MTAEPIPNSHDLSQVLRELQSLRDELDGLATDLTGHGANTDHRLAELADRLAIVEQVAPSVQPTAQAHPHRYQSLGEWVDEVFTRLATQHRAKWCTDWEHHLEARTRLEVLWHTWEAAMAAPIGGSPDWASLDEWLRLRLDHHARLLLDVDGPFAGCIPDERCAPAPRLAQRSLDRSRASSLARLDAYRRRHPSARGR